MSEHFFAVLGENQELPGGKKAARKRDHIAKSIDRTAGYVYYRDDATHRTRGWGYCRNYGHPFDAATANAITEAWAQAGV